MVGKPTPKLPWESPGTYARLAGLAVLYWGLAWVGLRFALSDTVASPVWPPAGLAVAAGVLWGRRALPAVAVGAFAVEASAGVPIGWSLLMAAGNTAEAALAAWVIARAGGAASWDTPTGVLKAAAGAALGPFAAASTGAIAQTAAGTAAAPSFWQVWATWYLGDLAGIMLLAPVLLLASRARLAVPTARLWEGVAAFASLLFAGFLLLRVLPAPVAAIIIAPLMWIAIRLGPLPTSIAVVLMDVGAVMATADGRGAYAAVDPDMAFLLLQAFMLTLALLGQGVAAVTSEHARSAGDLERRVLERTTSLEAEVGHRRRMQDAVDEAQRVAHMGTWYWDITKPHAEWSPELFRIYGLDPAGHVPTYEDYLTRVHPDDVERVKAATDAVFKDHKSYSHDERVRRPDGSWRHLHTWARAVTGPDGKLIGLAGACQDITESVAQEAKFRGLLESAPDAMVIVDAAGKIVLVNGGAERLFGYARGELLGQPIEMLVPEGKRHAHAGNRTGYAHHPQQRPMGAGLDLRARRKDGSEVPVEISLSPLETSEGLLVSSAIRDISARKAAERELAESLERFRALAEASPIGIVHTTDQGVVDYANRAWLDIVGLPDFRDPEAIRRAVHADDQASMAQMWRDCVKEGREFFAEMRFVRPDGSVRLTSSRAVPVRTRDGKITGFVSTVEDITERKASERAAQQEREARIEVRRLQELADFKTNFLRTAAHELGTPLTPIKIQLRVLRDLVARRPAAEEGKAVMILERNVDRLQVLVRDLLESARLQSGRLRLNPRSMDLAHAVHDVVETFQEPAIHAGIALDAHVPPEMAMVGDPDRITQVLYNLLSNAMKFTPAGGRVHVVAEDLGDLVRLTVEDTGSGFTEEQATHLFQPFSQVHDPMQVSKPGSGLGLYICKGIVEQHGGGITAYSAGPGKGARFTVSMPRVARPPPPPAPIEGRAHEAPQANDPKR